jgi:hypothetical protein
MQATCTHTSPKPQLRGEHLELREKVSFLRFLGHHRGRDFCDFSLCQERRRRNRAQGVGFVGQSHSDSPTARCPLASGSASGEGGAGGELAIEASVHVALPRG